MGVVKVMTVCTVATSVDLLGFSFGVGASTERKYEACIC